MIIAVDGPAASGKGTIAKALARHYGLPHLDTGLLYRAVGLAVLEAGGDPASPEDAVQAAHQLSSALDDPGLKSEAAGKAASLV
jgi:cytidylate kinase